MPAPDQVLVIVPARGGSKGVPRKNVRLLHGTPLIGHVLRTLARSRFAPAVWVSTDDDEIADVAARYGASVVRRPVELGADAVTLDPVVYQAMTTVEQSTGRIWDIVATVQPTSPLLSVERFDATVTAVLSGDFDSAITVVEDAHLRWSGSPERPAPAFTQRLNRQQLPPLYRETGAVVATRRANVTPTGRFGERIRLIELPVQEAVDIDSNADWWLADNYLDTRRVAFRVDGGNAIGLGHVHRALTLASRMFNHDIRFFMDPALDAGIRLAELHGMHVVRAGNDEFEARLSEWRPHVVLLDILDTEASFVRGVKRIADFVATFEDLGTGADEADLVFNELYADDKADGIRRFCGPDVVCLREEFYSVVLRPTGADVREVLVTFGGTDPGDLTSKALAALDLVEGDFHVTVVLGLGHPDPEAVARLASQSRHHVELHRNIRTISSLMTQADLALTSAGRTVFELLACQTPVVALAQNAREMRHTCVNERYGVCFLGLGSAVAPADIAAAVRRMQPFEVRETARLRMASLDLLNGPDRTIESIRRALRAREQRARALGDRGTTA